MITDNLFDVLCPSLTLADCEDFHLEQYEDTIVEVTASSHYALKEAFADMIDNYFRERREKIDSYILKENEVGYLSLVASIKEDRADDEIFRVVGGCLIDKDANNRLVWRWRHPFFREDNANLDFVNLRQSD